MRDNGFESRLVCRLLFSATGFANLEEIHFTETHVEWFWCDKSAYCTQTKEIKILKSLENVQKILENVIALKTNNAGLQPALPDGQVNL